MKGYEEKKEEDGYLVFLVKIQNPKILGRISSIQRRLQSLPYLEIIPPEELHISIKDCGYLISEVEVKDSNEIPQTILTQIITQARNVLEQTNQFKFRLGKVGIFPEAVFIEVKDNGAIKQIQNQLVNRVFALSLSKREKGRFLPHISIARMKSNQIPKGLKQVLEDWEEEVQSFGEFEIDFVELVKIDDRKRPTFETLERFRLRGVL